MKRSFYIYMLCLMSISAYAQPDQTVSQVFDNPNLVHSAFFGLKKGHDINLRSRLQWTEFPYAPKSVNLQYGWGNGKTGIGARLGYETAGGFSKTEAKFTYAYHIKLQKKMKVSVGLTPSYSFIKLRNTNDLGLDNPDDPAVSRGNDGTHVFDFDASAGLTYRDLTVAVTGNNLIQGRWRMGDKDYKDASNTRQISALAQYNWKATPKVSFRPGAGMRYIQDYDVVAEINLAALFAGDRISTGVTYRTNKDLIFSVGCQLSDVVYFGYSYDYAFSPVQSYTLGTHEIMISAFFGKPDEKDKDKE